MELENIWQRDTANDKTLEQILEQGDLRHLHSKLPLNRLRKNLLYGIVLAIAITVLYAYWLFYFAIWVAQLTLVVLILFNVILLVDTWRLYRRTPETIRPTVSVKDELTTHYRSFQQWWRVQQKISLWVYPIAVAGGFLTGGASGSGKPVAELLSSSTVIWIMLITVAVMMPICYFLAKWMFQAVYGKYLKQIKSIIDDLV